MRPSAMLLAVAAFSGVSDLHAQEASSGVDLRATITAEGVYSPLLGQPPRSGANLLAAGRVVLYPTWKLNTHWTVTAALQGITRPYYYTDFATQGHGLETNVLQASLNYTRVWNRASINVRVGQLSTAFGSFLLRYDDAVNPLASSPAAYGYYSPVTPLGLAGAEINATAGRFDGRAQFVNSSPANPRGLTQSDQYGGWAGGAGYRINQGFRIGTSAYRGAYLDRKYQFFIPIEDEPRKLPATALGVDLQFARGPWNVYSEWQHFHMSYHAIPTFTEHTGYAEVRRVLTPRWFLATRIEYVRFGEFPGYQRYEVGAGYRPNRLQLAKVSYGIEQASGLRSATTGVLTFQLVTALDIFSVAR
jgi:hypothetical protein